MTLTNAELQAMKEHYADIEQPLDLDYWEENARKDLIKLIAEVTSLRSDKAACIQELLGATAEYLKLRDENDRLKRIIARELSEEDELGVEYAYVNALREENARLRQALESIRTYNQGDGSGNLTIEQIQWAAKDALSGGEGNK